MLFRSASVKTSTRTEPDFVIAFGVGNAFPIFCCPYSYSEGTAKAPHKCHTEPPLKSSSHARITGCISSELPVMWLTFCPGETHRNTPLRSHSVFRNLNCSKAATDSAVFLPWSDSAKSGNGWGRISGGNVSSHPDHPAGSCCKPCQVALRLAHPSQVMRSQLWETAKWVSLITKTSPLGLMPCL